jgi:hypothetical protein
VWLQVTKKAAAKPQSLPEAAPTETTPALKLMYTNIYNIVTICFFHRKGDKDEIRYSNPSVRITTKYGKKA